MYIYKNIYAKVADLTSRTASSETPLHRVGRGGGAFRVREREKKSERERKREKERGRA